MYKNLSTSKKIALLVFLLGLVFFTLSSQLKPLVGEKKFESDLNKVTQLDGSFKEYVEFFETIAREDGARYAFSLLGESEISEGTDLHLLAHSIGDVLYRVKGKEGIEVCTHEFRNACSHSIVVGLFSDNGAKALDEIAETCREAPGGSGAYTMCFHGLGHGVLAYTGYQLPEAVELCGKVGTSANSFREEGECVGGVMMEMASGVHDQNAWEKAKEKYYSENQDPLYPCSADFMSPGGKYLCYTYLTPRLWELAGADVGSPTSSDFQKAFNYCDQINPSDNLAREACYGGFGKEFIVLVNERDIRDVGSLTDAQLRQAYDWCLLAPSGQAIDFCVMHSINSLYWGGENTVDASINYCNQIEESDRKDFCFNHLLGAVNFYNGSENLEEICLQIPENYQDQCFSRL